MNNNFSYLDEKISKAEFNTFPFKHLLIENFLSVDHFQSLVNSRYLKFNRFDSDQDAIDSLLNSGYRQTGMPGTVRSVDEYLTGRQTGQWNVDTGKEISTKGMAFRLVESDDSIINDLLDHVRGSDFHSTICNKFNINPDETKTHSDILKYLSGHEISPHPDSIGKAITFILNTNVSAECENLRMHTRLLAFKEERTYIKEFWRTHPEVDRDWLPWSWCTTEKIHNINNSMLIFSPSHDTLHGVKCVFDHLTHQRTMIYGTTRYNSIQIPSAPIVPFRKFDITPILGESATDYRKSSFI